MLFSSFSGGLLMILGTYECQLHASQNDYHYVNITHDSSTSVYLWKNRGKKLWTLHPAEKEDELRVDEIVGEYSTANWKSAKVTNEGIYGPHNDLYKKMDCSSKIYCFTL